jgi:hypothetical protein
MTTFNWQAEENVENDCILVQTDCTFDIALKVINNYDGEFHVNSCKVVIDTIETLKAMIQMIAIP